MFADNRRAKHEKNLERGKRINGSVLGRRIPTGDPRLFEKRNLPGKKDYFVLVGLDVSGSTARPGVLKILKEAAYAKAELLHRLGVKFAVYAHTGEGYRRDGLDLSIYVIKSPEQRWDPAAKERLCALGPASANLDGHTMEFYRKVTERQQATDKIIMYYTDGAMPLENYDEELFILQREIKTCKRQGITVVGVGIKNDDPTEHGLDTIRLDSVGDVPKVVVELQKRMAR